MKGPPMYPRLIHQARRSYWEVAAGVYQATAGPLEFPSGAAGYRSLDALCRLKGDRPPPATTAAEAFREAITGLLLQARTHPQVTAAAAMLRKRARLIEETPLHRWPVGLRAEDALEATGRLRSTARDLLATEGRT